VIAHTGKCADRLMSTSPAQDIHSKLRVVFGTQAIPTKMTLGSICSYTFAISKQRDTILKQIPSSLIFAYIHNSTILRSITCQTRKYPPPCTATTSLQGTDPTIEVWTLLSTFSFAQQYKTSQEYISKEVIQTVIQLMLCELEI
jgi:hypothetical protein